MRKNQVLAGGVPGREQRWPLRPRALRQGHQYREIISYDLALRSCISKMMPRKMITNQTVITSSCPLLELSRIAQSAQVRVRVPPGIQSNQLLLRLSCHGQLMSEEDAWAVIQKWRCIVDAHFDDSVHAAVSKFAELADELDVAAMDPAEQRRTVQATGFPLPEILETQGQRQLAMISLMHIHSRLVFKVTRSSLRCPACDTVLLPWDLPQPAPSTTPV